jgi:hypothetical protein
MGRVLAVPRLCRFYPGICLTTEEKAYYLRNCCIFLLYLFHICSVGTADGGTVVKVLRYKSEVRWFDSRWCHWNFSFT